MVQSGAPQQGKYAWVDIDYHNFTPRASWEAAALPKLGKLFDGLDHDSEPWRFFAACDALEQEYRDRATNSEKFAITASSKTSTARARSSTMARRI